MTSVKPDSNFLKQWASFIETHPEGNVYQSPVMYELFHKIDNFEPVVLSSVSSDGKLEGLLLAVIINEKRGLARYFSSRAVVYGGPICKAGENKHEDIIDELLQKLVTQVGRKTIFIQFRNFFSMESYKEVFHKNGFTYRERLNYLVDTSTEEQVRKNMSDSKLRQVKKGLKAGVKIMTPQSVDQVKEFYDILRELYKTKIKKPLPAWDFFKSFYELSIEDKIGVIQLVSYEERVIGGIMCPQTPGKTLYEWYVCGLDEQYKQLYPSVLATWAGLKYAADNKITNFDFMGVGLPGKEYGVRDFKARFGGEMVNYGRFSRINNKFNYHIAELGYNFLALIKQV